MGYAQDAMADLHGDRMIDNTPPTVQAAYAKENQYLQAGVLLEVAKELAQARATHAPMNGHHEGYAVILEELDELWEVCKMNTHKVKVDSGFQAEQLRITKARTYAQRGHSGRGDGDPVYRRRLRQAMIVGTSISGELRVFIHCFLRLHAMITLRRVAKDSVVTEWGCEKCLKRRAK